MSARQENQGFIVQVRDTAGFWCNAANFAPSDMRHAKNYAQHWTDEHRVGTRVVRADDRSLVSTHSPRVREPEQAGFL